MPNYSTFCRCLPKIRSLYGGWGFVAVIATTNPLYNSFFIGLIWWSLKKLTVTRSYILLIIILGLIIGLLHRINCNIYIYLYLLLVYIYNVTCVYIACWTVALHKSRQEYDKMLPMINCINVLLIDRVQELCWKWKRRQQGRGLLVRVDLWVGGDA